MWSSTDQNVIPLVFLLFFITPFTEKSLVVGSSISEPIAKRPDPLRNCKHYGGDYDIRNKHYWASAAFTGIHGYAVAGLWLLTGVGFAVFVSVKNSRGNISPIVHHPKSSNLTMFWLIILFTMFAITASMVIIEANHKSLNKAEKLVDTIFGAAYDTTRTIGEVKATLLRMKTSLLPYDLKTCHLLDFMTHRLRKESLNIHDFVNSTRKSCDRAIQTLHVVNLVVVSVNLVLLVAGLVLLILQHRPTIIVLIFSCWILTTLSWILTGADFFFYTFIGDTCSALKNFEEDPQNSSLTDMLPCPKSTDSDKTLENINHSVHSFIVEINSKIQQVLALSEENEEGQSVFPEVCDPFSSPPDHSYSPDNSGNDCITVGDLPSVLSGFTCYETNNTWENCIADGRFLPETMYAVSRAYSGSIQEFIDVYPDLSRLMKCSSVKQAFSDIVAHQCRPIELSTQVLWSSMLTLSLVMVVLVLLWSDKAFHDRRTCSGGCSVFP